MKILFITSWYPAKDRPFDGVFVREHARAASLYNNQIVIMHNVGYSRSIKKLYELSDQIEDGLRIIRIRYKKSPIPKTSYFNYLWSTLCTFHWLVKKGGFKPDIIHAHVFGAGVLAVIIGKIYRLPVVITEHFTGILRKGLNRWENLELRFAMNMADVILPVSNSLKDAILKSGVKNRIQVIPNPVDMDNANPAAFKEAAKDRKKILFIGFLTPRKGIPYLLEAVSNLIKKRDDFELDIVGDGPDKKEYEELSLRLGLERVIKFYGSITDTDKRQFLRECTFLVLPSLSETFGVVLIEAMAYGKPVIATSCDAVKEIVNEKTGLLVPSKDAASLTRAIDYMLGHYRNYSPEEIAQYAHKKFSHKVVGERLDQVYKALVNKR